MYAKISQRIYPSNGFTISDSKVSWHIARAQLFIYDKTPEAQQKQTGSPFHFGLVAVASDAIPLDVIVVRTMAYPLSSLEARKPASSDIDPDGTVTQVGSDQLTFSRFEVVNSKGDAIAYNKCGGVFARLIANGRCDESNSEVSADIYPAVVRGPCGFTHLSALAR